MITTEINENYKELLINGVPVAVYGGKSDKAFLFVHGQGGNKGEAARFYSIAGPLGYDVVAFDLPGHGIRTDGENFVPWKVLPEIKAVFDQTKARYCSLSVRATSIGAYFSLLALKGEKIDKCLLSSPLLDMRAMIEGMMAAANVSERRLRKEKEIVTDGGAVLSERYYEFAKENIPVALCKETHILYAEGDTLIPRKTVEDFAEKNDCRLIVIQGGEHWLHLPHDLERMEKWERAAITEKL